MRFGLALLAILGCTSGPIVDDVSRSAEIRVSRPIADDVFRSSEIRDSRPITPAVSRSSENRVSGPIADDVSRSFEIRVISDDPKADGPTGFKGDSSIFSNDDRIQYLKQYGEYAKRFFNDPGLDRKVVSLDQARERLKSIKPQPLPSVRRRCRR